MIPSSLLIRSLLGACVGSGLFVLVRSLGTDSLEVRLGSWQPLQQQRRAEQTGLGSGLRGWLQRLGVDRLATDLAVMERTPAAHAVRRIVGGVGTAVGTTLILLVLYGMGIAPDPAVAGTLVLACSALGLLSPDWALRRSARRRREDVVSALSAFLDLVTVLLAGGAGIETALLAAARAGDGWTFEQLRRMLIAARTRRESVWAACTEFGERIGVPDLVELGASLQLAGQEGARIARSLSSRAELLRSRVLAGIEARAQAASERMGLPTVLMFVGFLVLLGYPAAQIILQSP